MIRYFNQHDALDGLRDEIQATGHPLPSSTTWTRAKQLWLNYLKHLLGEMAIPTAVSLAEHKQLQITCDGLAAALAETEAELAKQAAQICELRELKNVEEVAEILVDTDERSRFEAAVNQTRKLLQEIPTVARSAIREDLQTGDGMAYPQQDREDAERAIVDGFLDYDPDDNRLHPSANLVAVTNAVSSVNHLHGLLSNAPEDFKDWFRSTYGGEPSLRIGLIFDQLLR